MSNASLSEIYFIAGMMILILIGCVAATYLFFKTFYKEKARFARDNKMAKKETEPEEEK